MSRSSHKSRRKNSLKRRFERGLVLVAVVALLAAAWSAIRERKPQSAAGTTNAPAASEPRTEGSFSLTAADGTRWADASAASANETDDLALIEARLTRRHGDPQALRFMERLSLTDGVNLYEELSNLIDDRHLEPASYGARTAQAARNLMLAIDNAAFRRAHGIDNGDGRGAAAFRYLMNELYKTYRARNESDALRALKWSVSVGQRYLHLPPGPIVAEFLYGAIESLDKYSAFVPPPSESGGPSALLDDKIVGIGVSIEKDDKGVTIVKVIEGGPAAEAGLKKGDRILSVDGHELADQSIDYAADLIGGSEGSRLEMSLERPGQGTATVHLVRRAMIISSVSDVQLIDADSKVGYFRLEQFTQTSAADVDKALWKLYGEGMQSLVIDLRGNPGGLLTTAIELSDKFVPCGTLVSTKGRHDVDNTLERAKRSQTWKIPLVVLVDENSASASEIFAAAIQENNRGIIVGRHSYGKGTVQTQFALHTLSASVRLTTARFYSPNGRVMAGAGVTPDIEIDTDDLDQELARAAAIASGRKTYDLAAAKANCPIHGQQGNLMAG